MNILISAVNQKSKYIISFSEQDDLNLNQCARVGSLAQFLFWPIILDVI